MARIIPRRPPLIAPAALLSGQGYRNLRTGTGALTVGLPLLVGSGSVSSEEPAGDSLTANAYSDYITYWVDPLNGNDSNNGTSKLTAKKSLSAASALLTGGGRRLIIVPSATIVLGAHWSLPAGGSSNDARVVVMGEPDALELPEIVGTGGAYNVRFALNGSRPYVTLRKVHLHSFNIDGGAVRVGYPNAMHDFIGEFCEIHDADWWDNAGAFYLQSESAHRAIIRYCKLYNIHNDGEWFHNCPTILSYANQDVEIHHCEMSNAQFGFRSKQPHDDGHGAYLHHNIIHQCEKAVNLMRDQGGTDGNYSGTRLTHSLIYDMESDGFHLVDSAAQSDDVEIDHVTFAEDGGFQHVQFQGAKGSISNCVFASDECAIMTKAAGSQLNRILHSNHNAFRSGIYCILGENLSGTSRREYAGLSQWQSAKTNHNHADLSELDTSDPDPDSVEFSSLTDTFTAHGSRNYRLKDTSSLKGKASDGGDPGYDPDDCGPGW